MTQEAKVISVCGNTAKVLVMRRSACEGCKQKNICHGGSCAEEKPIEATADNCVGAKVGDIVELSTNSSIILGVSFCVFVLPIIIAIIAYCVSDIFINDMSWIVAICSFICSCLLFVIFFNNKFKSKNYIVITKILGEENSGF